MSYPKLATTWSGHWTCRIELQPQSRRLQLSVFSTLSCNYHCRRIYTIQSTLLLRKGFWEMVFHFQETPHLHQVFSECGKKFKFTYVIVQYNNEKVVYNKHTCPALRLLPWNCDKVADLKYDINAANSAVHTDASMLEQHFNDGTSQHGSTTLHILKGPVQWLSSPMGWAERKENILIISICFAICYCYETTFEV